MPPGHLCWLARSHRAARQNRSAVLAVDVIAVDVVPITHPGVGVVDVVRRNVQCWIVRRSVRVAAIGDDRRRIGAGAAIDVHAASGVADADGVALVARDVAGPRGSHGFDDDGIGRCGLPRSHAEQRKRDEKREGDSEPPLPKTADVTHVENSPSFLLRSCENC